MSKRKRRRSAGRAAREPTVVLRPQDLSLLRWIAARLRQLADLLEAVTPSARRRRERR